MSKVTTEDGAPLRQAETTRAGMHQERPPAPADDAPKIPLTLSPGLIDACRAVAPGGQKVPDPVLNAVENHMRAAKAVVEQLMTTRAAVLSDESAALGSRVLKVSKISETMCGTAAKRLDAAKQQIEAELKNINQKISAPGLGDSPRHAEIRAVLRERKDRAAVLAAAIAADDNDVVVAALGTAAGALLTGLSSAELEMARSNWATRHHPDALDRKNRLELALSHIERAGESIIKVHQDLANTEEVKRFAAAQKIAASAVAAADAMTVGATR